MSEHNTSVMLGISVMNNKIIYFVIILYHQQST